MTDGTPSWAADAPRPRLTLLVTDEEWRAIDRFIEAAVRLRRDPAAASLVGIFDVLGPDVAGRLANTVFAVRIANPGEALEPRVRDFEEDMRT